MEQPQGGISVVILNLSVGSLELGHSASVAQALTSVFGRPEGSARPLRLFLFRLRLNGDVAYSGNPSDQYLLPTRKGADGSRKVLQEREAGMTAWC